MPTRIQFDKDHGPLLEEAAERLRSREDRRAEQLEGIVSRLARDENSTRRRATLKAVVDGALRSVVLEVADDAYSELTRAHDKHAMVSDEGDLDRHGRRWKLGRPRVGTVWASDPDDGNRFGTGTEPAS